MELARQSDVVIVIGGANSNNTRELVGTCAQVCSSVHHVRGAGDMLPEWFVGAQTVGLTAGTSTPDAIIDEVEAWLLAHFANGVDLEPKNRDRLTELFSNRFEPTKKPSRI